MKKPLTTALVGTPGTNGSTVSTSGVDIGAVNDASVLMLGKGKPNNWGLTPKAKGAQQNANNLAKGSDPNWLGGVRSRYGCTSMSAGFVGQGACEASNDVAWRVVA